MRSGQLFRIAAYRAKETRLMKKRRVVGGFLNSEESTHFENERLMERKKGRTAQ
jgi:hypothetical protein